MATSKLRRSTTGEQDERKLDMSPMIDMVFLLLIFFIVNATAIVVKTDPEVSPPIASEGVTQTGEGRIVVNVREDGSYTSEDLTVLPNEDAIRHYVEQSRADIEGQSVIPRLHLRGDKEALFQHSRKAVRAAANAGVNQVLFSTSNRER